MPVPSGNSLLQRNTKHGLSRPALFHLVCAFMCQDSGVYGPSTAVRAPSHVGRFVGPERYSCATHTNQMKAVRVIFAPPHCASYSGTSSTSRARPCSLTWLATARTDGMLREDVVLVIHAVLIRAAPILRISTTPPSRPMRMALGAGLVLPKDHAPMVHTIRVRTLPVSGTTKTSHKASHACGHVVVHGVVLGIVLGVVVGIVLGIVLGIVFGVVLRVVLGVVLGIVLGGILDIRILRILSRRLGHWLPASRTWPWHAALWARGFVRGDRMLAIHTGDVGAEPIPDGLRIFCCTTRRASRMLPEDHLGMVDADLVWALPIFTLHSHLPVLSLWSYACHAPQGPFGDCAACWRSWRSRRSWRSWRSWRT